MKESAFSDQQTYHPPTPGALIRRHADRHGVASTAREFLELGARLAAGVPWVATGKHGSFVFEEVAYPYLYHRRHPSWLNERAVEVPIGRHMVELHQGQRILEVGNVLALYGPRSHEVIDKYERAPGVRNIDALDLSDERGYDLIVSISTIEHIGWDERPQEPERALRAIEHLGQLLAPNGMFIFTVGVGYNPFLDRALADGQVDLTRLSALRRDGRRTRWEQVSPEMVWDAPYDEMFFAASGVVIGTIRA